jgi:hypothetical protein
VFIFVVFDRKNEKSHVYSTNTQQDAFLKDKKKAFLEVMPVHLSYTAA